MLIFPEGSRSRVGHVDTDQTAYGVGRLVASVPQCRVLCIYLRGAAQRDYGDLPARGDRFVVATRVIAPTSEHRGVRRSQDLARQIIGTLAELERNVAQDVARNVTNARQ